MNQGKKQIIMDAVMACGAHGTTFLPVEQIVMDTKFRDICASNGCGRYGRCYQCPPDLGPVEELMERVCSYPYSVLYQSVGQL